MRGPAVAVQATRDGEKGAERVELAQPERGGGEAEKYEEGQGQGGLIAFSKLKT